MPLFLDDSDRYSGLRLIAWWDQEKLRRAKVMVVGAGAIGNEVLKNLALLGIGDISIVDFDSIDVGSVGGSPAPSINAQCSCRCTMTSA